ncbi:MAG: NAD-dependent epimerase/dehydratase family protein [Bacteroidia bacterium]|nr:NAD-dependent epimerase/dehydratase family protein [Bacteroidia bacterium]NNF32442.1 NAD-dependent epimerase/dehydratase family protein [Flavobacteriaceae bacterium]NNK71495.1 NAD-dependent epimerase/dehydratase family protein [Flavobacteriaceae bacterium]
MNRKTILITGASGFVGRHLLNRLAIEDGFEVFITDREFTQIFPHPPKTVDWLIHLASSHRESEEKLVFENNERINRDIISLLTKAGLNPNILFTSSIHEEGDSFYGRSKKAGSEYLRSVCDSWNKKFEKIVFPNLFGPLAKPYHTSVVANFCQDIITGKESYINDVEISLMYIQDAINSILQLKSKDTFDTTKVFLPDLHRTIKELHLAYHADPFHINIKSKFESQLLSTLTSYY